MLVTIAMAVALALPASAQMMGPMGQGGAMGPMGGGHMGSQGGGMMGGGMGGHGMREGRGGRALSHEGPLISIMLEHKQDLGLNAEQERKLRDLRTEFAKESVRRGAEIRVAEIELDSLLEQDQWDLAKIEPKVKQIATLQGDLRLARIKTLEAGRAVLTAEQLEKLKQVGHRMRAMGGPGTMGPGMGMMGPGMMGPGMMGPGMMQGPGGPSAPRQ
jgi:Spy/CpxP family protein refolding chaperone